MSFGINFLIKLAKVIYFFGSFLESKRLNNLNFVEIENIGEKITSKTNHEK